MVVLYPSLVDYVDNWPATVVVYALQHNLAYVICSIRSKLNTSPATHLYNTAKLTSAGEEWIVQV